MLMLVVELVFARMLMLVVELVFARNCSLA
jgi:hypothetical protein